MDTKPLPKTGLARIWSACGYTLKGLKYALANEAAFRQEFLLVGILSLVIVFLPITMVWKGLLFFATALVLIVELLNSAIEAVVDLASPEFHSLAGLAKDMGSAAVFICLTLAGVLWAAALWTAFT